MQGSGAHTCHWAHIAGPLGSRRSARSTVWICEHPYPTMREQGPNEDCAGCPVWEEMQREQRKAGAARTALLPGNLVTQ